MPVSKKQLAAEPEALEFDLSHSAIVVVDMQNAFVNQGGMFDLRGFDISPSQQIIDPIGKILDAARKRRLKVIYIVHVLSPDLHEVGSSDPFWYKSVKIYRETPEWADKFIIRDTWGVKIIDALKPQDSDIIIEKPRFSAFFGTNFDIILKSLDVKNLFFTGCATNICVEASIRDAANLGYFPVLVSDATVNNGPPFMQEATIFNVKLCFGWVTDTDSLLKTLG
ncbi:cysteine hydrolase family protein [Thermodesulfobacteriota bacterium]